LEEIQQALVSTQQGNPFDDAEVSYGPLQVTDRLAEWSPNANFWAGERNQSAAETGRKLCSIKRNNLSIFSS
jgi:hypothetical protein